jgi:hypothetical protein
MVQMLAVLAQSLDYGATQQQSLHSLWHAQAPHFQQVQSSHSMESRLHNAKYIYKNSKRGSWLWWV